jgi:hypothetical protein
MQLLSQPLYRPLQFRVVVHIRLNQSANTEHGELLELVPVARFNHGASSMPKNAY